MALLESAEQKKKQGWALFGIEAGALIIVAVVLVILLNYFKIISFKKTFPFFNYPATQLPAYLQTDKNAVISASSLMDDYRLTVKQPDVLLKYFTDYNVLKKAEKDLGQEEPFKKIVIVLTPEQSYQKIYTYSNPFPIKFGYKINSIGDNLILYIFISDDVLKSDKVSEVMGSVVIKVLGIYAGKDASSQLMIEDETKNIFLIEPKSPQTVTVQPTQSSDSGTTTSRKAIKAGPARR